MHASYTRSVYLILPAAHKYIGRVIKRCVGGSVPNQVLRLRIRRIRMFLGLLDPDPIVRHTDPDHDPSIIKQK
jgi:hypothetical protein